MTCLMHVVRALQGAGKSQGAQGVTEVSQAAVRRDGNGCPIPKSLPVLLLYWGLLFQPKRSTIKMGGIQVSIGSE